MGFSWPRNFFPDKDVLQVLVLGGGGGGGSLGHITWFKVQFVCCYPPLPDLPHLKKHFKAGWVLQTLGVIIKFLELRWVVLFLLLKVSFNMTLSSFQVNI